MQRGLSAGRVQSVAVRIVVEREREIGAFKPVEYWTIEADVEGHEAAAVPACAWSRSTARRRSSTNGDDAQAVVEELETAPLRRREGRAQGARARTRWRRSSPRGCSRRRRASCASPPSGRWRWRSASTKVSSSATRARSVSSPTCVPTRRVCPTTRSPRCATYIAERYGKEYLPDEPVVYKTKKSAQDAHEAIRPTSMEYDPETVRKLL